ncbi:hypothetical protein [Rubrivirga sp. IMCC45206]|uniref:hypothetical protein n=1 Tax=Rubrivirga sp. IMCC45206 TaxID=3391614 RepID=UPI00398FDBC8
MILRRITQHVRDQNWTAIAIDFVIVVAGVFIGIQVSNWNADRVERAREATYLAQLRSEIASNAEAIAYQAVYVERVVEGGRAALTFLEADADCAADCETVLVDLFHASQVWGAGYTRAKYEEMVRLGLPTDEATAGAVQDFYQFIDGWDTVNEVPPAYRERVRGHLSPEAAVVLWNGCYGDVEGHLESLPSDCVDGLRALDVQAMLRSVRADPELAPQLRFWIGQNVFALAFYPDMGARADAAIAAIDRALGT